MSAPSGSRWLPGIAACALLAALPGLTRAATTTFNLVLEGWQQVGPYVATAATGSGTAIFDDASKQLTFNLSYTGLARAETMAHIHGPAARGANAGVLVNLSAANPKVDVVTLTAQQEAQLLAGELYVNIHTSAHPDGELRAQIDNLGATPTRALIVTKSGPGTGLVTGTTEAGGVVSCGPDCGETVPDGKVVTLVATPTGSSTFVGWSGACSGTGPCQVTMDAARNVDARFFAVVPRYVNAAAGTDSGACSVPAAPCRTITYAMGQASAGGPGDPVNVTPGTYDAALGEIFPITIKSGVQLQATGTAHNTSIDATGASQRALQVAPGAHSSTLLQGFTITGGLHLPAADGSLARGGGLLVDGGAPTIRRNLFLANEARGHAGAGAPYASGGEARGGAIHVASGTPTIVNNVFRANIARGGAGKGDAGSAAAGSPGGQGLGGAIYVQGGAGVIHNNTFHGNSAAGGAGGASLGPGGAGADGRYGAMLSTGASLNNNLFAANAAIGGDGGPGSPPGADGAASHGALLYVSAPAEPSSNLFHANTADGAPSTLDTIGTGSRCFAAPGCTSPGFHAEPTNLRLLVSSPAAGMGTATGAPADDFDGAVRGNPPSIGAFEPSGFGTPTLSLSATSLAFGGQSMRTSTPSLGVTLTNTGGNTLNITAVTTGSAQFPRTHNCTSLGPSLTCAVVVTFTPAVAAGALNSTLPVGATLTITSNATGSPHTVPLSGTAEKSLVTHYYRSVLRRPPDTDGKSFWHGEAARVAALGANVNEVWFALSSAFFVSSEYAAFNRNHTAFATDLYATFFSRAPDAPGLAFWVGNLDQGMPREVALAQFMFSTEFRIFTQAIFGNTAARAEVDMVMDFYRGLLARLPDDNGFAFWRDKFRAAQCQGQVAIVDEADAISSAFVKSPEYNGRTRTNAQYVGDLYNAFLRRGGDLGGVQFWIGQLSSGALDREQVRVEFRNSPEFQARVNAVIREGCL